MEIEVKKIRVTKSVIKQMLIADVPVLKQGEVLGMVINAVTDSYKTMLLKYKGDFYRISMHYQKGTKNLYRRIGRWTSFIEHETPEECTEFWEAYSKCCAIAENNHVYI